ncbi:homocysteine S-methyltransferase [Cordyceps javanica]|uniref:Homocysteine S-methyltransferase n=1 Tax=Cordyceps javanica TaxID=43265 RepID=A0A545W4G8_9HYPO|nr:homocysteine S-methyltransferase [Cordyceps javanica]TQW08889.1 homocysteine S-methyltransferase [Cordyceps javanica]
MNCPILILDGGLGTSLEQKYGCTFDHTTPLWSSDLLVSDPARLRRCQADFGRVPVDVLLTATYQVSVAGFAKTRDPEVTATATAASGEGGDEGIPRARIPHYIDAAVRIGREAAPRPATRLALSVGPYGACMVPSQEYSGAYDEGGASEEALFAWHRDRLRLFAAVGDLPARVSFVALETVPRVDELVAMRRALADVGLSATAAATTSSAGDGAAPPAPPLPFWASCLYPGDDGRLPDGSSVEAALRAMLDPAPAPPAWGVGINCTKVHRLDGLLRRYEAAVASLLRQGVARAWPALVLYPDGTNGEVYNTTTQTWERPPPGDADQGGADGRSWAQQLAEVVRATRSRGRWTHIVVGGCCMAGAEDIAALRAELL